MYLEQEQQEHNSRFKNKERKKHPHTHTFFPSLKLTQKNNTQISNVTTPITPLSLFSQKCHPINSNNKKPRTQIQSKSHKAKHKISLHINPPSNGGFEAKILTSLSKLSDHLSQCHWLTLQPLPQGFEVAPPAIATAAASERAGQESSEAPIITGEGGGASSPFITTATRVFHTDFDFDLVPLTS